MYESHYQDVGKVHILHSLLLSDDWKFPLGKALRKLRYFTHRIECRSLPQWFREGAPESNARIPFLGDENIDGFFVWSPNYFRQSILSECLLYRVPFFTNFISNFGWRGKMAIIKLKEWLFKDSGSPSGVWRNRWTLILDFFHRGKIIHSVFL